MTRIAVIEKPKCHPLRCGNYLCIKLCPVNRTGKECIVVDKLDQKAGINTELCTGCGICPKRCPFGAIHIVNLPEMLKGPPLHRYGANGFHLFNLPAPVMGKVIGIIGRNGSGKSTAVKILAGVLKPNLGAEKEADISGLIAHFKGTEAQGFFERVRDGKIRVSYKPQAVELIPKMTRGTVREILEKMDERGKLQELLDILDLRDILDSSISSISGGELQRVAIAAAVLKKAGLYIFDEPMSYLDISQRVRVAKFIRTLADEHTAVLVIEHDLIMLDYMADLVHIMFGEEGAYGIVSQVKSAKAGINAYLGGFLREENMKFRNSAITFLARSAMSTKEQVALTSWSGIRKTLDRFSLTADEGSLNAQEVIGIIGENGIGKTTFVKILAGVAEQDKGRVDKTLRVSYKPQYLNPGGDELVMDVLQDAVSKYDAQLIQPLRIQDLLLKKLCELSGGELQKVAIAECLSKDAKLYLLDEPSAYLDVEERLALSGMLRTIIGQREASALVVDHDLLFVNYLSDSLMVFDGKPAKTGMVNPPASVEQGMNSFLKRMDITMRSDEETNRPRINKPGSQMDRRQKSRGRMYSS